jgi:hypothetical protein
MYREKPERSKDWQQQYFIEKSHIQLSHEDIGQWPWIKPHSSCNLKIK